MGRPKKRRRSRVKVWLGRISTFFGICFALVLAALIGGTLWAGVRIRHATEGMPTADLMNRETPGGITQVYSTDKVLLGEIYSRFQERVRIEDVEAHDTSCTASSSLRRSAMISFHSCTMGSFGSCMPAMASQGLPFVGSRRTVNSVPAFSFA